MSAGVPCSRYAASGELPHDPRLLERASFARVADAAAPFFVPNPPFKMSGSRTAAGAHVPGLGEHALAAHRARCARLGHHFGQWRRCAQGGSRRSPHHRQLRHPE